jgi:peroxiredoxin
MAREFTRRYLLFIVGGIVVVVGAYLIGTMRGTPSMTGEPVPEFVLPDLNQEQVSLTKQFGKPLILVFFRRDSTACDSEMADLEKLYQENRDKGLDVIGVTPDATVQDARAYARDHRITFTILQPEGSFERGKAVGALFHLEAVPRILMIDANGIIRADLTGYQSLDQLRADLERSQILTIPVQPLNVIPEGERGEGVEAEGTGGAAE